MPDTFQERKRRCEITHVYDGAEAREIIRRASQDYQAKFPDDQ